MKYYKLKTVAFYIFVATIMFFDLKGSENENEGICPCCCCPDEGENKEEKVEEIKEKDNVNDKEEEDDDEKNFILRLEQCFNNVINEENFKKYVGKKKGKKKRLFIVDLKDVWNEIVFEELENELGNLFSYKKNLIDNLPLKNLSMISYCPKNNKEDVFEICEFKMNYNSTIKDVFDHFKNASTWVKEDCLILFIKDQDRNIVSLISYKDFFVINKENN